MRSSNRTARQPERISRELSIAEAVVRRFSGGEVASFFSPKRDRSVSFSRGLASSFEQTRWTCGEALGRRYPAPTTLHNFTRRRNGLNAAYRCLLRQESSFGATTMDAFRDHFRVLIAGGLAMAPPVPADRVQPG